MYLTDVNKLQQNPLQIHLNYIQLQQYMDSYIQKLPLGQARNWIEFYEQTQTHKISHHFENLGLAREEESKSSVPIERHFESGGQNLNYYLAKTNDDVRRSYLDKLITTGVLKLQPSKKYQSIIIFDWDDTLMSTSYLSTLESSKSIAPSARSQLNNLDSCAARLIESAATYGDMYIVTNAKKGWVQYSSRNYLPLTASALQKLNTTIISARTSYEQQFPGDFHRWKVQAFKSLKIRYQTHLVTNLICVGDSHIEMDAAHVLAQEFTQCVIKTIKFRQSPKPEQLIKQQQLVIQKLQQIHSNPKNLDIKLQKKSSKKQETGKILDTPKVDISEKAPETTIRQKESNSQQINRQQE